MCVYKYYMTNCGHCCLTIHTPSPNFKMKRFNSLKKVFKAIKSSAAKPAPVFIKLNHIYATCPNNHLMKFEGPSLTLIDGKDLDKLETFAKAALLQTEQTLTLDQAIMGAKCGCMAQKLVEACFVPLLNISAGTAANGFGSFETLGSPAFWNAATSSAQGSGTSFAMVVRWKTAVKKDAPLQDCGPECVLGYV